jgi:ribosome biogenesis protein YTM1
MAAQNDTAAANGRTSQVKIHLTSRSEDIQLPQDTGAILVSTGM